MTRDEFIGLLKASYGKFLSYLENGDIEQEAAQLLSLAAAFPEDTVLEKRGNKVQTRNS